MSLRHATLASLLDGEASGYELAQRMEISVANFWHALPSQLYAELKRLEEGGLVAGRDVEQQGRPTKRLFTVTPAGYDELERFTTTFPRPTSVKDELLIKVQTADFGDLEAVAAALEERGRQGQLRLQVFEALIAEFLRGRDEETFLATARRVGPYLNLRRGRDFERENLDWYAWAAQALRARAERRRPPRPAPPTADNTE